MQISPSEKPNIPELLLGLMWKKSLWVQAQACASRSAWSTPKKYWLKLPPQVLPIDSPLLRIPLDWQRWSLFGPPSQFYSPQLALLHLHLPGCSEVVKMYANLVYTASWVPSWSTTWWLSTSVRLCILSSAQKASVKPLRLRNAMSR